MRETKQKTETTPACPRCGSSAVARFLRGYPAFSPATPCALVFRSDGRLVQADEEVW